MLNRYYVTTPEYEVMDPVVDGQGPVEIVCDVIEIEAETARDAVSLGVAVMLRRWDGRGDRYRWCRDQRFSGLSPYAGVRAHAVPDAGYEAFCQEENEL